MKINRRSLMYIRISFFTIGWRGVKSYDIESKIEKKLDEYSYWDWVEFRTKIGII